MLEGLCIGIGMEYVLIRSILWKRRILKEFDWVGRKEASIEYCEAKYPELSLLPTKRCKNKSDGMSDAVCIGESYFKINSEEHFLTSQDQQ